MLYIVYLDRAPGTSRNLRQALLECIGHGWPMKWGHRWDIALSQDNEKIQINLEMKTLYTDSIASILVRILNELPKEPDNNSYKNFIKQFPLTVLKQIP